MRAASQATNGSSCESSCRPLVSGPVPLAEQDRSVPERQHLTRQAARINQLLRDGEYLRHGSVATTGP